MTEVISFPQPRTCPFNAPEPYAGMRTHGPQRVRIWDGSQPYLITSYNDVRQVLGDDEHFSADVRKDGFPPVSSDKRQKEGGLFLRLDNPEHARQRRMLTREFSVRATAAMAGEISGMADELIDAMLAGGTSADLFESYALAVPTMAICRILGVPYEDREQLHRFSVVSMDLTATREEKIASEQRAREFYGELVERRRRCLGEDLVSRLIREGGFTDDELPRVIGLLVSAGHETTSSQLALGAVTLLTEPEQAAALELGEPHISNLVEELVRFWSLVTNSPRRVVTADVEVGGRLLHKGEGIILSLVAANHDPDYFGTGTHEANSARYDRVLVRRHLGFGFGTHQCLGQNLARVELATSWRQLFRRIPDIRVAVDVDDLPFKGNTHHFGLRQLPVTWAS